MIKEFSTFGSCASRGIFNSKINKDYKKYFHVNYSVEASSLISLMSKPIKDKENFIDTNNDYYNACVYEDITKNFLEFLKEDNLNYLILDTYFDVICPIIKLKRNQYVTKTSSLMKTTYYKELHDFPEFSILNNFEEYYKLYIYYCNKFFKFINYHCKHLKVILNGSRSVYKYLNNGKILSNSNFKKLSYINNFRDTLDSYILNNFDVEFLPFDDTTLYDANYLFGAHHTHYESKYFEEKTQQLNDIIRRNECIPWNDSININYRKNFRKCILLNWNNIKLKQKIYDLKFPKIFLKYVTARIDIKNEGSVTNDVKILENSDSESIIMNPGWYKNDLGIGTQVQCNKGVINLKIKCVNDGVLKIILRGIDYCNETDKRSPIFINFTDFNVNGNDILLKTVSACHDDPIIFKKDVKDSEILDIFVKWVPF
ncbi:DUF6270 domain-containing protein [uncultured Methanobrevibacter sp.]|uniref:DUF6270 domain-containing protein n=1 Tax=uncultured Methanobrevibacter sp. TaxID=253161 RepID=UPI00320813A2